MISEGHNFVTINVDGEMLFFDKVFIERYITKFHQCLQVDHHSYSSTEITKNDINHIWVVDNDSYKIIINKTKDSKSEDRITKDITSEDIKSIIDILASNM